MPITTSALFSLETTTSRAALEHFDAALQIRPGHKNARNNRGLVFLYQGDLERGAANFAEVLAAAPDMGAALTNLGLVRSWQGKADESIALFERAVRSTPRNARCHFHLAHVIWQRDRERAKAEYGEGLRLEPDMIEHSRHWRGGSPPMRTPSEREETSP